MKALEIHIEGIVQGIGFRPFIYNQAIKNNLKGWVRNNCEGLCIFIEGEEKAVEVFLENLQKQPPKFSRIQKFSFQKQKFHGFKDFRILKSDSSANKKVLLSPDFAICDECEKDILDPINRRHNYAFTTCTKCGPRYSIIEAIPYDRENTSMKSFQMCTVCADEYEFVQDRRYYSQTNSCGNCGVHLSYIKNGETLNSNTEELVNALIQDLNDGKIVAVKGIGGFLLFCDATNAESVKTLRERKKRPAKPFALLYPELKILEKDVEMSLAQQAAYNSVVAPIVLFKTKENQSSGIALQEIAPGLNQIGVMRPYAPLLVLISRHFNKPLIATSANLSGSSIIFKNESALKGLNKIADSILLHDRDIIIPEDDSVIRFSPENNIEIKLRRSRGQAPNYFNAVPNSGEAILAMGADLKSSFCIQTAYNTYISQYLGDLDSYDSQQNFEKCIDHLQNVLEFKPEVILSDMHPEYASTRLANDRATRNNGKRESIQHHEAHFAAVLAENNLIDSKENILGVIWDGTGYGTDSNIWGGEFFLYKNYTFNRIDHFDYYPHILGDKMPKEPRLSALSIFSNSPFADDLKLYFDKREWELYTRLIHRSKNLKTSSVGRIFDAVACILGLGVKISYEGEAALKLEQLALKAKNRKPQILEGTWKNPQILLESVIKDLKSGMSKEDIAYDFHLKLLSTINETTERFKIKKLAFSGGVFQNALLVDMIISLFGKDFEIYFHKELSPNDENISFGQLIHYIIDSNKKRKKIENTTRESEEIKI